MTKIPRWIKKLSTMYRPDRKLFDGAKKLSRFYREKPRDLDGSKFRQDLSRKEERMAQLKRTCWGSIEKLSSLKKKSFSRREKHIEMNAASKLLKHRSNQHIKLSNTHLSTYMQSIHRSKTHTLTNFISRFKMWSLTAISIKNYENQFFRFDITHVHVYVFRFSFLITLNIYKDFFKGRHTWCKWMQRSLHLLLQAYYDRRHMP